MTASRAINDKLMTATIAAMKSMGVEKWQEAKTHLTTALELDPHNIELQQMMTIVTGKTR
jgi:hypothetical protein